MRPLMVLVGSATAVLIVAFLLSATVFQPPAAADRLAGVTATLGSYSIDDLADGRNRLDLTIILTSPRDIDECIAFALDEPFSGRRIDPVGETCPKAVEGTTNIDLVFERLTDSDLTLPSHASVWGIPGGRCGLLMEAFGVCVVEQAGTVPLELPDQHVLPSIGPLGSFFLVPSYEP